MLSLITPLCLAAAIGVVGATASTCGVGLISGTSTWCGLPLYWLIGIPTAVFFALVLGLPFHFAFEKLGLRRWWQYALGGLVLALPFWYSLAQPFSSARWLASGFFDSLNYLGSGTLAGIAFWWLAIRQSNSVHPSPSFNPDAQNRRAG
jgi:hypothetical protein